MDKTDKTNVLVSVFKISSTGMGHFGEMHLFPFPSLPFDHFDVQDIKIVPRSISFEIIVACPQPYGLTCIFCPMLDSIKKKKNLKFLISKCVS